MDDNSVRNVSRMLPVLIHMNQEHVMARAEIFRSPDKILIQIVSTGTESQLLGEFLEQVEPIALSFGAVPVRNIRQKRETN